MKFGDYINESTRFVVGDWVKQEGSDYVTYGKIIEELKNKSFRAVTFQSIDGKTSGKAVKKSLKGWYPAPVKIKESDVPKKIADKIYQKIG